MDHQTFDRLTHLFAASGSRRTACRALLAAALFGAAPRRTTATPSTPCTKGNHQLCGGKCCPGKCFTNGSCEVCCTGNNIICHTGGQPVCCLNDGKDSCATCTIPDSGGYCKEAIAGSYRRR